MKWSAIMIVWFLSLLGCSRTNSATNGITVRSEREDVPRFKRIYHVDLDDSRSMTITIKRGYGLIWPGRDKSGELNQGSVFTKWVFFDPDNVADKILDRDLVPIIERRCKEIADLDDAWVKSDPSEFTDDGGTVWKKVK